MIVYGYAIEYQYTSDGTFLIKVRIPSIHGPMKQSEYNGQKVRGYVQEQNLPWYQSLVLPQLPGYGQVVALVSTNSSNNEFLVIGLTGGQYNTLGINITD